MCPSFGRKDLNMGESLNVGEGFRFHGDQSSSYFFLIRVVPLETSFQRHFDLIHTERQEGQEKYLWRPWSHSRMPRRRVNPSLISSTPTEKEWVTVNVETVVMSDSKVSPVPLPFNLNPPVQESTFGPSEVGRPDPYWLPFISIPHKLTLTKKKKFTYTP